MIATDEALRVNDRMADVHYLRGLCFRDQRRFAQAQQALEKAVELSPGMVAAREELAELYGSVGRHADELEQLQVLAGLDRDRMSATSRLDWRTRVGGRILKRTSPAGPATQSWRC